jgi:trigger factor
MRKKFLAMLLALCAATASLTACGSKNEGFGSAAATGSAVKLNEIDVNKYVKKLGEYKGLTYTKTDTTVTDDEVEAQVAQFLAQHPEQVTDSSIKVKDGDTVNIDYCGKKDGVAFDGGTASGQALTIGSNSFIDGFEEGLIGHTPGETVDLDLKFPDNYRSEGQAGSELNGAAVVFTVTINYIEGEAPKTLTDDLVAAYSSYKTADEYRAALKKNLEAQKKASATSSAEQEMLPEIVSKSSIDGMPDTVHDKFYNQFINYYKQMASYYGMSYSSFLTTVYQTTEDAMNSTAESYATRMGQQYLVMLAIAQKEGIKIDEATYQEELKNYYDTYGSNYASAEEFETALGRETILEQMITDKVLDLLMKEGKAVEKAASSTGTASESAVTE